MYRYCIILWLFLLPQVAIAQDNGLRISLGPSVAYSYSGINLYLPVGVALGRHEVYAGPKVNLSGSYIPYKSLWGFNAGYNYTLLSAKRFSTIINADYQHFSYEQYNSTKDNQLHELNLTFGVRYHVSRRFNIAMNMGSGLFIERFYNTNEKGIDNRSGVSHIVKLQLNYNPFKW